MSVKVYLAAPFSYKDDIAAKAAELKAVGVIVTSSWLKEKVKSNVTIQELKDDYHVETAWTDLNDIERAKYLVIFTVRDTKPSSKGDCDSWARGGRHTEFGYALALARVWHLLWNDIPGPREVIVCGPKENIFHFLNTKISKYMKHFDTFEEVKQYLRGKLDEQQIGKQAGTGDSSSETRA